MSDNINITKLKGSDPFSSIYETINANFEAIANFLNNKFENVVTTENVAEMNLGTVNSTNGEFEKTSVTNKLSTGTNSMVSIGGDLVRNMTPITSGLQKYGYYNVIKDETPVTQYTDEGSSTGNTYKVYELSNDKAAGTSGCGSDYVFINSRNEKVSIKSPASNTVLADLEHGESVSVCFVDNSWYLMK